MIYVVSGFPRTGTTMMMSALQAGGMTVTCSRRRNEYSRLCSDDAYKMNPDDDLFELTVGEVGTAWMYREECVCKVPAPWIRNVPEIPGPIAVISMQRDSEEVRQSFAAIAEGQETSSKLTIEDIAAVQAWGIQAWKAKGASVLVLEYSHVLESPADCFRVARGNGWPIDVDRATKVVDPEKYRFKRELLTVGI